MLAAALGCSSLIGCAAAGRPGTDDEGSRIRVDNAWVRSAASGSTSAYADIVNIGARSVTIRTATSPPSPFIQLYETLSRADGVRLNQEVPTGFQIPGHTRIRLAPGGRYLALTRLVTPIRAGSDVRIALVMEDGSAAPFSARAR
ncbi:copper chaperone PCu(A)C [Gordonia crocea]|nr:copper chaperone PCu(A)C [Gordonia crocea]